MQQTPPQSLPRVIGPWIATAVIIGTVIGSGVFKKGRNVADNVPEFGLIMAVWVLGGLLALLGALALAEVAVLFPRAGGNYVFLREGYGRCAGFLWGWVDFWILRAASIAALATMFTESFHDVLKQSIAPGQKVDVLSFWPRQLLTTLVIGGLTVVNVRGTRLSGGVQFAITILKVASLLFLITAPFVVLAVASEPTHPPQVSHLSPAVPSNLFGINWSGFGVALVGVLWAYNGWMNIAPIAEEVKEPQRNIPRSLLLAVFTLIALYCGANLAYHLVLPRDQIVAKDANGHLSSTPVATEFCGELLGPVGVVLASAIVMTSVFGALNGNLLVGPRLLYAMGRDRLAPPAFARLHPQYHTPALATLAMAGWSVLLVLCVGALTQYQVPTVPLGFAELDLNVPRGKSPFDIMTDFVIFGSVTFETLAVASIFVFRWKYPATPGNRAYRCWGYPVVPALYVLIMALVLVNFFVNPESRTEALVGLGFIASGGVVYALFFGTRRA
ncbi:Serine/threonine exchanger SteT [Gemmata obscuriglobus]|uniref:Amino acid permease n=1 Tax=Gemmata obscuriglobus TaxID=114 RepID=A0A2Z3H678_9BACT|nr:amino acid permease [Gemmata obscuriglobus]AWM39066.1 amino acid permease [Gemmata obscuriglobus]QEG27899.1 Serine/threonine exchanger SteT [Gemmata obscuriglobus]VTS05324.1 amino acid transporter : Amino acid transporter OS=Singulisphaera acidiphila (strain ATCC BAA-1392 / DSM 18658 / VKM B-2454 / MOB10) GN=Sinac_6857 PE=4 SV=1: AA_permease_2 [Gemmata obscuriglobus UQM 2246]